MWASPSCARAVAESFIALGGNVGDARATLDRANERRWGPRPVDIDLLAYDEVTLAQDDLILPHPRLFERAFVLIPLAEIAADRLIAGTRVRDALARADAAGIERLPPRDPALA